MNRLNTTLFGIAILALSSGSYGYGTLSAVAAPDGPCFSNGSTTYRILPHHAAADYNVRITDADASADVTMNIAPAADAADFAMLDDSDAASSCARSGDVTTIALGAKDEPADVTIALTSATDADYRIFVQSDNFSAREAAALFAVMLKRNRDRDMTSAVRSGS